MNKRNLIIIWFLLLLVRTSAQQPAAGYQLVVPPDQDLLETVSRLAAIYSIDLAYVPETLAQQSVSKGTYTATSLEDLLHQLLAQSNIQYRVLSDRRVLLRNVSAYAPAEAKEEQALHGRIIDAETGQPMVNVALALDTLNLGTLTDEHGQFALPLPAQRQGRSLLIHHIGYRSQRLRLQAWTSGQTISLQPEPFTLAEVVVVDQLPTALDRLGAFSARLSADQLKAVAGLQLTGYDLFRRIQLLAGIAADDDLSADIRIRGSNADETLLLLDGMPLYRVDHFYGVFSAIHTPYLAQVDLYKNTLPVSYGGRTGGMLHMRSAESVPTEWSGQLDLDLLTASGLLHLPISERWSLQLSGRQSHTNVADSKLFDWVGDRQRPFTDDEALITRPERLVLRPDFSFQDAHAKLLFEPKANQRFSANFYHSADDFQNQYTNSFLTGIRTRRVMHTEQFSDGQNWDNLGMSLLYRSDLGRRWSAEADVYYTRYAFDRRLEASLNSRRQQQEITRSLLDNRYYNTIAQGGTRIELTRSSGGGNRWKVGMGGTWHDNIFRLQTEADTVLGGQGQAYAAQFFAAYQGRISPHWEWSIGGRMSYFDRTGEWYPAPRIHTAYRWGKQWRLKAAFGVQQQFVREIVHEDRLGQSHDLIVLSDGDRIPVGVSTNWMLGASYQHAAWSVDIEAFYRTLDEVIDHASLQLGFGNQTIRSGRRDNYRLFRGQGRVSGLDFSLAWMRPSYESQVAYTWSKAINSFPAILRGLEFPARNDRRHQLKWTNKWKLGRWELSANAVYSSGRPYYDLALLPGDIGDRKDLRLDRLVNWLPSYQRLDAGIVYQFPLGSTTARLSCAVFNVTNHDNVKYLQYIYSVQVEENNRILNNVLGAQTDLLDRTLSVGCSILF